MRSENSSSSLSALLKKGIQGWPLKYIIAVAGMFIAKAFLLSAQNMSVRGLLVHDDALFIKLAYFFSNGSWLGDYNSFTLIKGFFYPMFIAITHLFGLPLFTAHLMLYGLACFVIVHALLPLIPSAGRRVLLFTIIFFNPVPSAHVYTMILRDNIYASLLLLVVAAIIGLFLNREGRKSTLLRWSALGAFSLFALWHTREEGWLIIPLIAGFTLLSTVLVMTRNSSGKWYKNLVQNLRIQWKTLLILIFPYIFLSVGNIMVATINYMKFDGFIINELKSKAFSDAFSALASIKHENWIINVPVPKDARRKAYQVSPTLATISPFLDHERNPWKKAGSGDTTEIKGGWFMWAFRAAADQAGYHENLPKSQQFYSQVAREINAAFASGKLEKNNNLSFAGFTWDNRILEPTLEKFSEEIIFVSTFAGYSPYSKGQKNELNEINRFQVITGEPATITPTVSEKGQWVEKVKFGLLKMIGWLYHMVNPILAFSGLISFLIIGIIFLLYGNLHRLGEVWIILAGYLYIVLHRMLLIAIISVSSWHAMNILYLNIIYPFLLLFEVIALFCIFDFFKHKFYRR